MTRPLNQLVLGVVLTITSCAGLVSAQYPEAQYPGDVEDYFVVDQADPSATESDTSVFTTGELGAFDPTPTDPVPVLLPAVAEVANQPAGQPSSSQIYLTQAVDAYPPPPGLIGGYMRDQEEPVVAKPLPTPTLAPTIETEDAANTAAEAEAAEAEAAEAEAVAAAAADILRAEFAKNGAANAAPGTVAFTNTNVGQMPAEEAGKGVDTASLNNLLGGCGGIGCGGCTDCGCPIDCCPPPCAPMYWIGGVEATYLSPDLNRGDVSYRLQDQFATPQVDVAFGSNDIAVDDFYAAPRLWLGVQHGCWGLVGRYWHMQAAEHAFDPFFFNATGPDLDFGYFINNRFEAYTTDLEATRSCCFHDTRNTFSFGVRHGSLTHDASLSADAQINDGSGGIGVISGNARSNRRAFGTGITSSFYGRKPLFCNSCIHVYYGLRGSVLWGKISNSVETDTFEVTSGATAGSFNGAFTANHDSFFIGEAQLGLQWDYRVMCFPADAFFRVGLEYQYWDATTGSATATSFAGFGGPPPTAFSQGQAFANADGLSLDLFGVAVATGFMW